MKLTKSEFLLGNAGLRLEYLLKLPLYVGRLMDEDLKVKVEELSAKLKTLINGESPSELPCLVRQYMAGLSTEPFFWSLPRACRCHIFKGIESYLDLTRLRTR